MTYKGWCAIKPNKPNQTKTYYDLNWFSHIMYTSQASTYKNIVKFLTPPCIIQFKFYQFEAVKIWF